MSQDIRERIRRLLRLAESSNVHEAAAAAAKAQELLSRHQLDQAEIAEQEGQADEPLLEEDLQVFGARMVAWRAILGAGIAEANGCDVYNQAWRNSSGKQCRAMTRIVGPQSSVSAVRYMIAYLEREVERLSRDAAPPPDESRQGWIGSFRLGAAYEIASRAKRAAKATMAAAEPGCALARIDRSAERVKERMAEKEMGLSRKTNIGNSAAFMSGIQAGRSVDLASGPALPSAPAGQLERP